MSETYTGAEVYAKLQESMDFMRARVSTLDVNLNDYQIQLQGVERRIDDVAGHLASAYLTDFDLHDSEDREALQTATGMDLAYVVDKFARQRQNLGDQQLDIRRNRLYLMRSSVKTKGTEQGSPVFVDERLNEVLAIEEHPGYTGEEGLLRSGYVTGDHRKGLFGFRHRRLRKLAQAVAEDLDYASFEEMERGHVGDLASLHQRAGRLELRHSIPILALHPGSTVREVLAEVRHLESEYSSLERELENLSETELRFAAKELANHFEVVRPENLDYDSVPDAEGHVETLNGLKEERAGVSRLIDAAQTEMTSYSKSIAELSSLLAKSRTLRGSDKPIAAEVVDKIFAHESGNPIPVSLPSLRELDAIIRRDFPQARAYSNYTRTRRHVGTRSEEYRDVVRRAGGEGKWTKWRKVR